MCFEAFLNHPNFWLVPQDTDEPSHLNPHRLSINPHSMHSLSECSSLCLLYMDGLVVLIRCVTVLNFILYFFCKIRVQPKHKHVFRNLNLDITNQNQQKK